MNFARALALRVQTAWGRLPVGLRFGLEGWALWRLPLLVVLTVAAGTVPQAPGTTGMPPLDGPSWLWPWHRWDSGWYTRIIQDGYYYLVASPGDMSRQSSIQFFPLYPLLSRGVMVLGVPMTVATMIVSHVATVLALWGLYRLTEEKLGAGAARHAPFALLVFPTAIFLSAAYTEATLIALAVWALTFFERRQALAAGVCVALAAVTRANGAVLVAALCAAAAWKRDWRMLAACVVLPGLTLGSFSLYQYVRFGDALAVLHARNAWGVWGQPPLQLLRDYAVSTVNGGHGLEGWLDCLAPFWLLGMAIPTFRRLGPAHGLFVLGTLGPTLLSGQLWGLSRIALCAVPVYVLMGDWADKKPRLAAAFAAVSAGVLALEGFRFVNGYWTG